MKTAFATIEGFEVMRMFKKGQLDFWTYDQGVMGEIRLIERQFDIYFAVEYMFSMGGFNQLKCFVTEP